MIDKILDAFVNKMHVILGALCQGAILLYVYKTGRDIGPGVQNSVYAFYGFLAGHFGFSQKWPDQPPGRG